jgi:hypothetical protein
MNLQVTALIASTLLIQTLSYAQSVDHTDNQRDPYFQISQVTSVVKEQRERKVSDQTLEQARVDFLAQNENYSTSGLEKEMALDPMAIADILFKVWDIVVANKPVVTVNLKNASALPNLAENHWERLSGWKHERSITYQMQVTNGYGIKVIDLEYRVKLLFGGGVRGKGRYIASARVTPTKIDVQWGYNLDVGVTVPAVVNMGTEDDPLAAIYLDVTYKIHNILRSTSEGQSYLLQGDGMLMNTKTDEVYYESVPRT